MEGMRREAMVNGRGGKGRGGERGREGNEGVHLTHFAFRTIGSSAVGLVGGVGVYQLLLLVRLRSNVHLILNFTFGQRHVGEIRIAYLYLFIIRNDELSSCFTKNDTLLRFIEKHLRR